MKHPELVYASPVKFTLPQRMALCGASVTLATAFKAAARTCRVEYHARDIFDDCMARHGQVLVAVWHETLGLTAWCHRNRGFHTLTSYSYDGELAARVVRYFGFNALRGSSSRGGWEALKQLGKALELGETLGLTVDGPRGPRRQVKPGIALLAKRSGLPIVPAAVSCLPAWRLNSWDRLLIPKPFGRIVCAYGAPVSPPNAGAGVIEKTRREVESRLVALQNKVDDSLRRIGVSL